MANQNARVLGRVGARELTVEEVEKISGAAVPTQTVKITHVANHTDILQDFDN